MHNFKIGRVISEFQRGYDNCCLSHWKHLFSFTEPQRGTILTAQQSGSQHLHFKTWFCIIFGKSWNLLELHFPYRENGDSNAYTVRLWDGYTSPQKWQCLSFLISPEAESWQYCRAFLYFSFSRFEINIGLLILLCFIS